MTPERMAELRKRVSVTGAWVSEWPTIEGLRDALDALEEAEARCERYRKFVIGIHDAVIDHDWSCPWCDAKGTHGPDCELDAALGEGSERR